MIRDMILEKQDSLLAKSYEDINIYLLEEFVEAHPNIKKAELYLGSKGELFVEIKQCQPIFRIFEADTSYYLDNQFEIFPLSDNYSARVVQVYLSKLTNSRLDILRKLKAMMKNEEFVKSLVTAVSFDRNNEIILHPRIGKHIILLGKASGLEKKMEKLKAFYVSGINKIGWDRYSKINLKFDDQVVCTKK
jgi:cell division protein FtsQ